MIFTQALRSKHRQRRVATRVVRNERKVKQGGETWSKVKITEGYGIQGALRVRSVVHVAAICRQFHCASALAGVFIVWKIVLIIGAW